jgi:hypothetical protein
MGIFLKGKRISADKNWITLFAGKNPENLRSSASNSSGFYSEFRIRHSALFFRLWFPAEA